MDQDPLRDIDQSRVEVYAVQAVCQSLAGGRDDPSFNELSDQQGRQRRFILHGACGLIGGPFTRCTLNLAVHAFIAERDVVLPFRRFPRCHGTGQCQSGTWHPDEWIRGQVVKRLAISRVTRISPHRSARQRPRFRGRPCAHIARSWSSGCDREGGQQREAEFPA